MANLTISTKAFAYTDATVSNNPARKMFDSSRSQTMAVSSPGSKLVENLPAGETYSFFNGVEASGTGANTAWTVTLGVDANKYRFTAVSGTVPALRTDRGLTLNAQALQVVVNVDSTVTLTLGGGTWGSTTEGDTVFLPGPVTGDAATPFSVLNQGFWVVLAVLSSTSLQCARPSGEDFSASAETQTLTATAQVQSWSAAGIQAGDSVDITSGFAPASRRTMTLDRVTPTWFEVISTVAVPLEAGKTPGTAGMIFYSNAKRFLRIEADQEIGVRINGLTTDYLRISPQQAGSLENPGWLEMWGPVYSLTVYNRSSQLANVQVFSAE